MLALMEHIGRWALSDEQTTQLFVETDDHDYSIREEIRRTDKGTTPRENFALGKFSVACKCIFISNHHLFLQCTTCLSGGIQQHSNTQTQDQTSDSKGLGSRYKCMCILQSWMCACQHTVFEELLFQWPIVHESTAQHPVLHMQMMMPIGIYKQDQRGFHSTTEGNSIYRLIFY